MSKDVRILFYVLIVYRWEVKIILVLRGFEFKDSGLLFWLNGI